MFRQDIIEIQKIPYWKILWKSTGLRSLQNDANFSWTSIQLKARLGSKIHKTKLRNVGGRNARTEVGKLEKFWLGEDRHLFWSDTMG